MTVETRQRQAQVQALAHLRRGIRPVRTPQWLIDGECRAETLPLFELPEIFPGKETGR